MPLLLLALAPAVIIMLYVYFRDRYEKEPIKLILKGILLGAVIIFPVGLFENILIAYGKALPTLQKAAWDGFVVAGATEEAFKFLAVFILVWRNRNFNEKFDGIVYAVSVSLGFAAIENMFYVFSNNSLQVGLLRAFTAVPGHAVFGIVMGFYLGLARFSHQSRGKWLLLAFTVPWLLHGLYDFMIMSGHLLLLAAFVPFLVYLYRFGLKRMREFSNQSVFNPVNLNIANRQDIPYQQNESEKNIS